MNTRTVHLFIFDTMSDWEGAFDPAAISRCATKSGQFRVVKAAATMAPVRTRGGVLVQPDVPLDSIGVDSSALLLLPDGRAWEEGGNTEALALATRFISAGVPVAAISRATLALSHTGIFDRLRETGIAREFLISSGSRGTAFYCGLPVDEYQNGSASTSPAPVDFAREIFSALNLDAPSREAEPLPWMQCRLSKFSVLTAS